MFALSSAEATPTTALPVSTPSVTGCVYVVFGGGSSLMVKGVRRTTLAFPSLSRSRAMAGTQGIKGWQSGVRTYTRHINRSFRKNALLRPAGDAYLLAVTTTILRLHLANVQKAFCTWLT